MKEEKKNLNIEGKQRKTVKDLLKISFRRYVTPIRVCEMPDLILIVLDSLPRPSFIYILLNKPFFIIFMKIDLVPMAVLDQWKEAQSNFEGIQILDADIFPEKVFEDFRQRYQDSKRCHAFFLHADSF